MHWRTGTHNLRLWAPRLRSMWHRSRLFTRPFSHAPVFLSFVLSHGVFPYSQIRSQWVPRVFFLLYPFGFSDAYFVFVRYTKSSVKVPFLIFHAFTRAFTHEFPFPYAVTMRFLMRSSAHQRFMCFKTSSRVFRCIPPPSAWPVPGCFHGTFVFDVCW